MFIDRLLEPGGATAVAAAIVSTRETFYSRWLKRWLDVMLATAGLIAVSPFLLLVLPMIIFTDGYPPIYRQKRLGRFGQVFELYKLRTMREGAEAQGFCSLDSDPRATRLGQFLRKTYIDELPQLWNVIKGDMSLIGPRPLSVEECRFISSQHGYGPDFPGYYHRVRPGLTGLEQMNREVRHSYTERFALNHSYELKLSWATDLAIFVKSLMVCRWVCIAVVLSGAVELVCVLGMIGLLGFLGLGLISAICR